VSMRLLISSIWMLGGIFLVLWSPPPQPARDAQS